MLLMNLDQAVKSKGSLHGCTTIQWLYFSMFSILYLCSEIMEEKAQSSFNNGSLTMVQKVLISFSFDARAEFIHLFNSI